MSNQSQIPESRQMNTRDIEGAYPMRFRHKSKKLFVDRREAMSIFGQSPGKYHGYANDYKSGGTYKANNDNMIVDDFAYYTKFKMAQKDMLPKPDALTNDIESRNISNFNEFYWW